MDFICDGMDAGAARRHGWLAMLELQGTYTALVTPFQADDQADESIDWRAFDALVDAQIEGGISGLVPCGTIGGSPTLSEEEQLALVKRSIERARARQGERVPVIAGTGSSSTHHAVRLSKVAEDAGADAVMVVVPYYNKPTQEGLLRHYVEIAQSVRCPVMIPR